MKNLLAYSGIAAKIRGMKKHLLKSSDYRELISMTSVQEGISFLQERPGYQEIFSHISYENYHREAAEELLNASLFKDYEKIYLFASQKQRKYLKLYFMRYEVDLLKSFLRIIFSGKTPASADPYLRYEFYPAFYKKYSELPVDQLAAASTTEEFMQALQSTRYYAPLKRIQTSPDLKLFDYAMALDLFVFSTLWKKKNKVLTKKDLDMISFDQGTKIDLLNIMWICRAKKYYSMPDTDLYSFLIPVQYKLKKEQVRALAEAKDFEDISSILKETYYGKYSDMVTADSIEDIYEQVRGKIHLHQTLKNPYSMAAIHSYLYLKKREIDRLTMILECIRYQIPQEQILEYANKLGGTPA